MPAVFDGSFDRPESLAMLPLKVSLVPIHKQEIKMLTLTRYTHERFEMAKRGRDNAVLSSAYPVDGSASEVNSSDADAQVVFGHRYLVFHLFC